MPDKPHIHVVRREPHELTDLQFDYFMDLGRREGEVIMSIADAARAGDRERVWELAQALITLEEKIAQ